MIIDHQLIFFLLLLLLFPLIATDESSSVSVRSRAYCASDDLSEEMDQEMQIDQEGLDLKTQSYIDLVNNSCFYPIMDILTCGSCGLQLALSDITKFINHKRICRNKDNCRLFKSNNCELNDEDDEGSEELLIDENDKDSNYNLSPSGGVGKQAPSIINSSQRHKLKSLQAKVASILNLNKRDNDLNQDDDGPLALSYHHPKFGNSLTSLSQKTFTGQKQAKSTGKVSV